MLRSVQVEVRIDHPVERVFAYLADPSRWHLFSPAVALRRQIGDGPPSVGTRWAAVDRIGPFRVSFTDELVTHEDNRRVVWHSSAPWNARSEYACQPTPDGTLVRAHYQGDVVGWLRVLSWVPPAIIARVLARDFRRLRRRLADDARRATPGSP
jgi:uncharacterized protein YndB with AHSA1/START domain